nr:hypothetical protein [Nitrosomonas nitrosa]
MGTGKAVSLGAFESTLPPSCSILKGGARCRKTGDRDRPAARRAVMVERVKIPQRGPDRGRTAIRVKVPSGSFNACRRWEFSRGDARNRAHDTGSAIRRTKTDGEKPNDEMGRMPLWVSAIRDGAEQGTSRGEG